MINNVQPTTAVITAKSWDNRVVAQWSLMGVLPVRWTGPTLNHDTPKVATETLEIAHHGILPRRGWLMAGPGVALSSGGGGAKPGDPAPAAGSSRPQVDKAKLLLYESKPVKGGARPGPSLGEIEFQFNPKELTIAKTAKYERKPARRHHPLRPPDSMAPKPAS